MKWLSLALCASLSACAGSTAQSGDMRGVMAACERGVAHAELHAFGTVRRVLGIQHGRSGSHLGFIFETNAPAQYRVEDNIDLTGYIPLRAGEQIELQGQYECNDGVIHWTHRDPSGRHIAGFIKADGRTYR